MPWYLGNSSYMTEVLRDMGWVGFGLIPLALWSLAWKGFALWYSAKRNQPWWFIALLVLNTVGILEIIYLVFVAKVFSQKTAATPRKTIKRKR